ncbi:hypothetical protein CPB84DRAFT_1845542 [Gymnopilus junonius]|uniref:Uncharacterized protein n=1 Tax=Gymnopilus junonius TaxID=109634 RepID=A0A9P5NSI3_GYMJU|nr:hypothetical protein CPB84DRAFT_1845542 [Gymnopilus junonius]
MVPLSLFLNTSLLYLSVHGANVPTFKVNPKPGEKKRFMIIDYKKLLSRLNLAKLEMSHAEWIEAAYNCFCFQSSHNVVESSGTYSSWWEKHFNFFNLQKDKVFYYNTWKSMDLEIYQEFYAQLTIYNAAFYVHRYDIVKNSFDLKSQMKSMLSGASKVSQEMPSSVPSVPFPSGSSKLSPLACCILYGEHGQTL